MTTTADKRKRGLTGKFISSKKVTKFYRRLTDEECILIKLYRAGKIVPVKEEDAEYRNVEVMNLNEVDVKTYLAE